MIKRWWTHPGMSYRVLRFYYKLDTRWCGRRDGVCPSCGRKGLWNHGDGCETQSQNVELLHALFVDPKERRAV